MVKIVTYMGTLMQYAHNLGQARLHGTPEEIEKAQRKHDSYRDLCLMADDVII